MGAQSSSWSCPALPPAPAPAPEAALQTQTSPDIVYQQHRTIGHDREVTGIEVGKDADITDGDFLLRGAVQHCGRVVNQLSTQCPTPWTLGNCSPSAQASVGGGDLLTLEHGQVFPGHSELTAFQDWGWQQCQQGTH